MSWEELPPLPSPPPFPVPPTVRLVAGALVAFWGRAVPQPPAPPATSARGAPPQPPVLPPACGARLVKGATAWAPLSVEGAPPPRAEAVVVAAGKSLFVWGGLDPQTRQPVGDGAVYDPATDAWRPVNAEGAPTPRHAAGAVWTGKEVIVWGGRDARPGVLSDGAAYDPASDSWRALPRPTRAQFAPRSSPQLFWTGSDVLVVGGVGTPSPRGQCKTQISAARLDVGARKSAGWRAVELPSALTGDYVRLRSVLAAGRLVVWKESPSEPREKTTWEVFVVDLAAESWRRMRLDSAPHGYPPLLAFAVGAEVAVWGRYVFGGSPWRLERGGVLDPVTGTWRPLPAGCQLEGEFGAIEPIFDGKTLTLWGAYEELRRGARHGARLSWSEVKQAAPREVLPERPAFSPAPPKVERAASEQVEQVEHAAPEAVTPSTTAGEPRRPDEPAKLARPAKPAKAAKGEKAAKPAEGRSTASSDAPNGAEAGEASEAAAPSPPEEGASKAKAASGAKSPKAAKKSSDASKASKRGATKKPKP